MHISPGQQMHHDWIVTLPGAWKEWHRLSDPPNPNSHSAAESTGSSRAVWREPSPVTDICQLQCSHGWGWKVDRESSLARIRPSPDQLIFSVPVPVPDPCLPAAEPGEEFPTPLQGPGYSSAAKYHSSCILTRELRSQIKMLTRIQDSTIYCPHSKYGRRLTNSRASVP
ncbi:uncharacterized protein An07g02140 [Aspergillus niger]|uniref:Contig An07c0040, genomic contig n=2 Tax=Aspergillus niger TaxID=5061 RepID=A2QMH7_ASPNC|nr:uncharacterized protein An07g02140 [Aspergillus niger]CAK39305.1 unnamed protein product [Aspergillus niger]